VNILDENISDSQRRLLSSWRIYTRQIGFELGKKGMSDDEIIPLLHQLSHPTFYTRDSDFYHPKLCHPGYCLVYLDVRKDEVATFIRRFLRHKSFKTRTYRMGTVVRVSHIGLAVWHLYALHEDLIAWA